MSLKKAVSLWGVIVFAAVIMFAMAFCKNPADDQPETKPKTKVVDIADIQGVTIPATGGTPVKAIKENAQYTGTVTWEPEVDGTFAIYNNYRATITLKPKSGYTLEGVAEDFFKVEGAYWVSNSANSGVITAEFPQTTATLVNIAVIQGISAPVAGAARPETIETFENEQYSGSVYWLEKRYYGDDDYDFDWFTYMTFKPFTQYAVNIILTPKEGYTVQEVPDGFFTVEGAELVSQTYEHPYLIILAVFPETGALPPNYGIFLSATNYYPITFIDEHTFPTSVFNYTALMPLDVFVYNSGDQATGDLRVALSGTDPGSFTLSETSLSDIEEGKNWDYRMFTVVPKTGLDAGTHTATVTVSGSNGITAGFDVDFTVIAPTYGISLSSYQVQDSLSASYIYTIPAAAENYAGAGALYVTVSNTGNQPAGDLNITLGGTNSGSFNTSLTLIPDDYFTLYKTPTFRVTPNTGLVAGTYTATVTVSGSNSITASFNVSFTVNPPTYSISLSTGSSYTFPAADFGYTAQTPLTITVSNTGNQKFQTLNIYLSGTSRDSFTISKTSFLGGMAAGDTGTFTVVPKTGLAPGIYTATITLSGLNGYGAVLNLSFTVNAPTYGVSVSQTGTHTFPDVIEGYGAQTALNVSVTNTSNQATGGINLALTGADLGSFTLSTTSINSIAVGGNSAFAVRPNTGLAAGIYTATITLSGNNGITAGFNVSFTVNPATYGVSLSRTDTHTFTSLIEGYGAITPLNVTVTNTGNQPTGSLNIALTGTNPGRFTLSTSSINNINVNGSSSFTVRPNTGLSAGTHTAAVTVSGSNGITANFNLSFSVIAATYGITISAAGDHTFPAADFGYTAQNPLVVTVTNDIGNQPTGSLNIALTGTNPGGFTLSASSISSIAVGGTGSFTVRPTNGLSAGTYTAAVTVSGSNGITAGFNVSFFVDDPTIPYIITGSDRSFTATRNGITIGTANQLIRIVIGNIRTHAEGRNRVIQFGSNGEILYIDASSSVNFNNTDGTWGAITLTGKINLNHSISIDSVSVTSSADVTNSATGSAFFNEGVLNITGGTVSAVGAGSITVYNGDYGGVLNISGGTITATGTRGIAVYHPSGRGKITVSGTAKITSMNTETASLGGTICLTGRTGNTAVRLEITGGTVENTVTNGYAINNRSDGSIIISGGTVSATGSNGIAVYNFWGTSVIISGGRISAPNGYAVSNGIKNAVKITSPPAVIVGRIEL